MPQLRQRAEAACLQAAAAQSLLPAGEQQQHPDEQRRQHHEQPRTQATPLQKRPGPSLGRETLREHGSIDGLLRRRNAASAGRNAPDVGADVSVSVPREEGALPGLVAEAEVRYRVVSAQRQYDVSAERGVDGHCGAAGEEDHRAATARDVLCRRRPAADAARVYTDVCELVARVLLRTVERRTGE